MEYVFYEFGLSINVMYTVDDPKKRAAGFKLLDAPAPRRRGLAVDPDAGSHDVSLQVGLPCSRKS